MRNFALFVLMWIGLTGTKISAQELKGRVIDATNKQGVPYALVIARSLPDSAVIDYVTTTEKGYFIRKKIGIGRKVL